MAKTRKIVKHLRSRESSEIGHELVPAKPMPNQMVEGEIAMNYLEGYERLYIKNSNGDVVTFYPNGNVTVDDELSSVSENPVQNKVITEALEQIVAGGVVVDDYLSVTSTNPVQNNIITTALNGKQSKLTEGSNIDIDERTNVISASDAKVNQTKLTDNDGGRFPFVLTGENLDNKQPRNSGVHYLERLTYEYTNDTIIFTGETEEGSDIVKSVSITPEEITFSSGDRFVSINQTRYGGISRQAERDGIGNVIVDTYATKEELMDDELTTAAALTKMNESAGFDNDGGYTPTGTNVVDNATSLAEAIDLLDDAIANINVNSAIANYLENNGINGGEYYGS